MHIGDNYLNGNPDLHIERNVPAAIHNYELAAVQGNAHALENLGLLNLNGVGMPTNYTRARDYLESAV